MDENHKEFIKNCIPSFSGATLFLRVLDIKQLDENGDDSEDSINIDEYLKDDGILLFTLGDGHFQPNFLV